MAEFTIKQIFKDHWNNFIRDNYDISIRPIVFDEVEKIINCGNPDFGYALYVCNHCNKFLKVPFRCKSRFCNTCGVKYAQDRALSMAKKSIRCTHRHIVFTMSDKLWPYFQKYRFLLNGLFEAASKSVLSWFYEINKSQNFKPGIMCTLHTFGRDLKWNPHIHMLCTEGGAGNTEFFRIIRHINFKALRFRWQKLILDYLSLHLPAFELPNFKKIKNLLYNDYKNGFYVYAKPDNITSIQQTINYVVRYYEIYSKEHKHSKKLIKLLNNAQIKIKEILRKWHFSIELSFKYDPTKCSCGGKMIYFDLFFPKNTVLYNPLSHCIMSLEVLI